MHNTGAPPAWYLEEPAKVRGDSFFLDAFARLGTTRQFGAKGGFGPIPWTAIRTYALEARLPRRMVAWFCDVIIAIDAKYLHWMTDRREAEAAERQAEAEAAERQAEADAEAANKTKAR